MFEIQLIFLLCELKVVYLVLSDYFLSVDTLVLFGPFLREISTIN